MEVFTLIIIVLIMAALKLFCVIHLSWGWVLSPFILAAAFFGLFGIIGIIKISRE